MPFQTLIAKDPNNRPVFDNSASPTLAVWELVSPLDIDDQGGIGLVPNWPSGYPEYTYPRVHGATFINLDFVNTKISVDIPGVKVRRIGAPTFDAHTRVDFWPLPAPLRCACPARGSDHGMQV